MELSQWGLLRFSLVSFVTGIVLGSFYDLSSILPAVCGKVFNNKLYDRFKTVELPCVSNKPRHKTVNARSRNTLMSICVFAHDLIFMCFLGGVVSLIAYVFNDGVMRVELAAGVAIGIAMYMKLMRKPVLFIVEALRFAIRYVLAYLLYYTITPIKHLVSKFSANTKRVIKRIQHKKLEKYIQKYTKAEKSKLLAEASNGCILYKKTERRNERKFEKEKSNNSLDNDNSFGGCGDSRNCKPYGI